MSQWTSIQSQNGDEKPSKMRFLTNDLSTWGHSNSMPLIGHTRVFFADDVPCWDGYTLAFLLATWICGCWDSSCGWMDFYIFFLCRRHFRFFSIWRFLQAAWYPATRGPSWGLARKSTGSPGCLGCTSHDARRSHEVRCWCWSWNFVDWSHSTKRLWANYGYWNNKRSNKRFK